MSTFLSAYEQRHMDDRVRIETMMRYAETTFCRMRFLREYFGEDSGGDCGHCDNCRAHAEGRLAVSTVSPAAATQDNPKATAEVYMQKIHAHQEALFHIGDRVRHRRFGTGQVVEIAGQSLGVDFGTAGQKRIRRDFVQKVA